MPPQRLHPAGEGLPFSHIPYPYLLHEDYPNLQKGVQLTDPPVSCFFPQWSPDEKQLAFGSPGGGKYAVYRVSRDGGAVEQLLDDATTPNWSPDGKQLEVATHIPDKQLGSRDSHRVKILDLKSGVTNDTPGSTGIMLATWSPDGRYLIGVKDDNSAVMLYDFRDRHWSQLADRFYYFFVWSKDSKYVYCEAPGTSKWVRFRILDKKLEEVLDMGSIRRASSNIGGPAWSGMAPDGSLLVSRDVGTQELYSLHLQLP